MALEHDAAALLTSSCARQRCEGVQRVLAAGGPVDLLLPLLQDDAPYLYAHAGRGWLAEVRADALVAIQDLCRAEGRDPGLGLVTVRKAMAADDAQGQAQGLLGAMPPVLRDPLLARVDAHLDAVVQPAPHERAACRAYRVLQELGRVTYIRQALDPRTLLTPLQAQVHGSQAVSDRPRPHLRLSDDGGTLGFVFRQDGRWVLDFTEAPAARRAARMVGSFQRGERGELPRVVGARQGAPRSHPDGSLVLDGTVPRDVADPLDYLCSLQAFCQGLFTAELSP
ncbi:hypothetical protein L6R53_24535 [Myxococcota bacterium]|nr:hypothetical protein [Myxococcota bacterium]